MTTTAAAHSATSAPVNLAVDNNTTWQDAFQFGDDDDTTWNLNGCSFALDVRVNAFDAQPKLSLSSDAGTIVIADPILRVVYLNAPSYTFKTALPPGIYVYDLIMTDSYGRETALMHGTVEIVQGVTGV